MYHEQRLYVNELLMFLRIFLAIHPTTYRGRGLLADPLLNDMKTIRLCMINANSTTEDILNTMDLLDQIAVKQYKALCENEKS